MAAFPGRVAGPEPDGCRSFARSRPLGDGLWVSLEYQEIVHLRTGNVISDLILVDPVAEDFTSQAWAGRIRTAGTSRITDVAIGVPGGH
jgi:hypothetical protein